jgi:hypothetical protein
MATKLPVIATLAVLVASAMGGACAQSPAPVTPATAAGHCDRACLQRFVDQYLQALVAKDPTRLPLAAGARFTENGQQLQLGDGLWGTIDALEDYKFTFADPRSGQVGFMGTIKESGRDQILGVRLKVAGGKIQEIETLVVRPKTGYVFGAPKDLRSQPVMVEALMPAQRRPRAELIRIANSYFEGLEKATEKLTPFAEDCQRIENGVVTANNPNPAPAMPMWHVGCHAQFATHFSQFITHVRDRRFPIVDEERGLVLALVFFDHAGRMKTQTLAVGTVSKVPADMQVPFTFEIAELFKIQDGKISRIEALVIPAPYGMRAGWSK